ncbi:MAG: FKBP-type peptidyl-prolyl cis-trans isomerase [candidate division KSB1 bacterium]|nr:FKBP-type peptidyl-prolyl cis-trans isomerase [candidate division KSB1 bacterium]MDZ7364387.1 FKBP-type peptidyl-prolyl cis-trans isomerase [candidate division KSB1 bacterium]MDZ7402759.1 FKBP-type peptidyl-prolyl cis-trans isomerase [candidate division KSB1 bacterium]
MRFQLAVSMVLIGLLGCQTDKDKKIVLETQKQKVSYSIGLDIGRNLKQGEIDIDLEALGRGIKDAVSDSTPLLTEAQIQETMQKFQQEMIDKQSQSANRASEKNTQEGEAFLAENAKKEGVITLPSGLQYKVIKAGSGRKPKLTDEVTTHYRGMLIDGTEFDSSYKRGEPTSFPVDGVIAGWTEALQLMPVGSKWQLFVPPNLAYGPRGAGNAIGPNATLIFDIELLAIK